MSPKIKTDPFTAVSSAGSNLLKNMQNSKIHHSAHLNVWHTKFCHKQEQNSEFL